MIKNDNVRLQITFSKKQAQWLEKTSKKLGIEKSKLVRWLISKNIGNLLSTFETKDLQDLIKIAKTPWIIDKNFDS